MQTTVQRHLPCQLLIIAYFLAATSAHLPAAIAQAYPTKPIQLVTTSPGGGNDFAARLIAQGLREIMGQPVLVVNRGGGGGIIAGDSVAKAPADGYTLILHGSTIWLLPFMRSDVPWDPIKDFAPITLAVSAPNILVVHPSLPVGTVTDLIALAKSRPGELNDGAAGTGSASHLSAELFKFMAKVKITRVSYRGAAPALNALLSGEVQLLFPTAASVVGHVNSGRLRALAVTSRQPARLYPNVPTIANSGLPGYESITMTGILAPGGMPAALMLRINEYIVQVLNREEVKEKFSKAGVDVVGSSPEQFSSTIKSEMLKWGTLIKNAGIRAE
ncbi:MAG: tripartite tricarboxylate transporter substrate binding protein [Betaproteobacteria bacterium]|nr:tripartite tricarboxylate transporter substrate binding protein [Betaproteobacteria bacterium]